MKKEKAVFCWSGGKDSALCLFKVLQENKYEVIALLTTINDEHKRVSMHGVREELIEAQAENIGIPLIKMYMGKDASDDAYARAMELCLLKLKEVGVEHVIFGDIFLGDLKLYREKNLESIGMKAIFPLWNINTKKIVTEFIDLGFRTVICCVSEKYFDENTVGIQIDNEFLSNLSADVDPCGENGEFHTFTFAGPLFKKSIAFKQGEKVLKVYEHAGEKNGFWFIDLMPLS